jgi:hypothetical protein
MTASHIGPLLVVLVALAGLGALVAFRSGARGGYKMAQHSQWVTRTGGNLARALGISAVIVGVQWAVVSCTTDPRAWGVVLGVPALFAGAAIARLFSGTELVHGPQRRTGQAGGMTEDNLIRFPPPAQRSPGTEREPAPRVLDGELLSDNDNAGDITHQPGLPGFRAQVAVLVRRVAHSPVGHGAVAGLLEVDY